MIRGAFNDILSFMQDYVSAKAAYAKKIERIDTMAEYSDWKKDQLRAEQRDAFASQREKLIQEFAARVDCIKREMREKQTKLNLESPALANALRFINSFTEDSKPDLGIMQKLADCFAGDNNMLELVLCAARNKNLNEVYLNPIEKRVYSESKMDYILERFQDVVSGRLMIQSVVREVIEAAYTCGIVLVDPDIHDDIGETEALRRAMGLRI